MASVLGEECERLKQSLTYTQEEAPRDLSGVVSYGFALAAQDSPIGRRLALFN